jgi:lipoic acid synthetase
MEPVPLPMAAGRPSTAAEAKNLPPWLKVKLSNGPNFLELKGLMRGHALHTVCEEARCPNIYECWEQRTATFLILGDVCTRNCGFCAIKSGRPTWFDDDEPRRVAETVALMGLKHVVITSVTRDDLPDGGASLFAATIEAIRVRRPDCSVEVLIPDLLGNWAALETIVRARPDILNHNTETVPRLYRRVRPKARYERSLELLRRSKELDPGLVTKSGLMVGLGEEREELLAVFRELREQDVDVLTVGQYMRPDPKHLPVVRYYPPEEFAELRAAALALGFRHVEAGPLVRSSYHAASQVPAPVRR